MKISEQKKQLRKTMLAQRASLSALFKEKYDQWICELLWELVQENDFKTIHCYLPIGTEINITPFIEKVLSANLTVVTPKTLPQRRLQHLILKSLDEIEEGLYKTRHPADSEEFKGVYDLIIVPGLAFDKNNYRIGYGGGYYDNFMIHYPEALKVGVFYPFQEVEKVPVEAQDLRLDEVLVRR